MQTKKERVFTREWCDKCSDRCGLTEERSWMHGGVEVDGIPHHPSDRIATTSEGKHTARLPPMHSIFGKKERERLYIFMLWHVLTFSCLILLWVIVVVVYVLLLFVGENIEYTRTRYLKVIVFLFTLMQWCTYLSCLDLWTWQALPL